MKYAVLDYDGNLLSDWIRPVDPNTDWSHVGDGIYYVGNTAGTDMMFNIETFEFFEVPVFESFIADDIYSEKQSATWSGLYSYADGYGINRFRTNFIDGKAYISLASTTDKSDISFFTLDIHGNAEFVGAIPDCTDLLFSEALKSYVVSTYADDQNGDGYADFVVKDMHGNLLWNLSNYSILSSEIGDQYIGICVQSENNYEGESYFTILDRAGRQLFEPIRRTNQVITIDFDNRFFTMTDNNGNCDVYDFTGKTIHTLEPIELRKKVLLLSKDVVYNPVSIDVCEDYFCVVYKDDENTARTLIGTVKYN